MVHLSGRDGQQVLGRHPVTYRGPGRINSKHCAPPPPTPGCGSPVKDTKWAASYGISGKAPILGYNPSDFQACCDRCQATTGCSKFTFLQRPASVGNLCYLYLAGANGIATLPSTFSTFYSGEGEHTSGQAAGST